SEAMRLNPKDPEAPFNRGLSYLRLEKYDYAGRDFSEVVRMQPRNAAAYVYRGIVRIYQDKEKDADADFQKAFQIDPALKNKLQPLINEAKENAKAKAKP
ncbi:MAG: tetratricopeptide repeat protein, partial [Chloroflexota bacterium]